MTLLCNVCGTIIEAPVFVAPSDTSVTSLSEVVALRTRVWQCATCSHLSSDPLPDNESFYAFDYKISVNSDDEDQVYEVRGDKIVYRGEHQMAVFSGKVELAQHSKVLDFGCAKATMMRSLKAHSPDTDIHLFDVSRTYEPFWEKLVPPDRRAVDSTPAEGGGRFDLVTSFFAFEHIATPRQAIDHVHSLLKPGGVFYAVVPYALTNPGDFIVVDHVNHFTRSSMHRLLANAGFDDIDIDSEAHLGALVVRAVKGAKAHPAFLQTDEHAAAKALAVYWQAAAEHLKTAEEALGPGSRAIYGAGFYGVYIYSMLAGRAQINCFIDRSPFLQGTTMLGLPVLSPDAVPSGLTAVFVGLNPQNAPRALPAIAARIGTGAVLIPLMPPQ